MTHGLALEMGLYDVRGRVLYVGVLVSKAMKKEFETAAKKSSVVRSVKEKFSPFKKLFCRCLYLPWNSFHFHIFRFISAALSSIPLELGGSTTNVSQPKTCRAITIALRSISLMED